MSSATGQQPDADRPPFARRAALAAPLVLFALLAGLFYLWLNKIQSGDNPSDLPSALIGKAVPEFSLEPVAGLQSDGKLTPGFSSKELASGQVTVVNVWSSWCGPCKYEHPLLAPFKARSGVRLFGLNYKDTPEAAQRLLGKSGNPFDAVGADVSGRVAIDWGVYAVPETFVVDGQGKIVFKLIGPITEDNIDSKLMPAINKARSSTGKG
jgi:cytochrome c biogenesis protein CcmG, thiol:disulfide interchange protein DsbE